MNIKAATNTFFQCRLILLFTFSIYRLAVWSVKCQKMFFFFFKVLLSVSQSPIWCPQMSSFVHNPKHIQFHVIEEDRNKKASHSTSWTLRISSFFPSKKSLKIDRLSKSLAIDSKVNYLKSRCSSLSFLMKCISELSKGLRILTWPLCSRTNPTLHLCAPRLALLPLPPGNNDHRLQ